MKLIILFFVTLLSSVILFSQDKNPNLTKYVKTFQQAKSLSKSNIQDVKNENQHVVDRLTPLNLKTGALSKYIKSISLNNFLNIIDKRNKAYEEDLFKPQQYWLNHDENIEKNFAKDSIRFGIYEGILREHLEDIYGDIISSLILSPSLLRVKIIGNTREVYKVDKELALTKTVLIAEVEDIIKGENSFKKSDIIEFYYYPFWRHKEGDFETNKSYFVSLIPVVDNINGEEKLALDVNKVNDGFVEISENIVQDNKNYYGLGKKTWEDFKNQISSLINIEILKGVGNEK